MNKSLLAVLFCSLIKHLCKAVLNILNNINHYSTLTNTVNNKQKRHLFIFVPVYDFESGQHNTNKNLIQKFVYYSWKLFIHNMYLVK